MQYWSSLNFSVVWKIVLQLFSIPPRWHGLSSTFARDILVPTGDKIKPRKFHPLLLHILESFFLYNSCQQNLLFHSLSIVKYVLFQNLSHIFFSSLPVLLNCLWSLSCSNSQEFGNDLYNQWNNSINWGQSTMTCNNFLLRNSGC